MIAALLDNYRFQHEAEGFKLKKILWRRVMDINDRGLRQIITGLGEKNGIETQTGFDITPASEIMAIMCFATSLDDFQSERHGRRRKYCRLAARCFES